MVEGELPEEGLAALDGDGGDVFLALARKLADADGAVADERSLEALFAQARSEEEGANELLTDGPWTDDEQGPSGAGAAAAPAAVVPDPLSLFGAMDAPPADRVEAGARGRIRTFDQLAVAMRRRRRSKHPVGTGGQLDLFAA